MVRNPNETVTLDKNDPVVKKLREEEENKTVKTEDINASVKSGGIKKFGVMEHEKEKSTASQRFIERVESIVPQLEAMERTVDAARETTGELGEQVRKVTKDALVKLRDEFEDVTQADIPQGLRDQFAAVTSAVAQKFEHLMVRTSLEAYEKKVEGLMEDMMQVDVMLKAKGESAKVRDEMRSQLERLTGELNDLDKEAGHAVSDVRERADKVAHGVWKRIHDLISGEQPKEKKDTPSPAEEEEARALRQRVFEDARQRKAKAKSAWMPHAPVPPYRARFADAPARRATLAAAPAIPAPTGVNVPQLPENWDELDDAGKTNALDDFLHAFKAEHRRIVGEHEKVMHQLTEQIKERKLQELRESLN